MSGMTIMAMGHDSDDFKVLRLVASEFGWRAINRPANLEMANQKETIAAVLLCRDAFGPRVTWREAVRRVRQTLPGARVVTCHRFAEPIDWGELFDLGTFHAVRLPLNENETRQSLGFIWQAEQRSASHIVTRKPGLAVHKSSAAREVTAGRTYAAS